MRVPSASAAVNFYTGYPISEKLHIRRNICDAL